MSDPLSFYKQAESLARENLQQCAREVMEWRKTGILQDGKIREMEKLLDSVDNMQSTRMAEDIVLNLALEQFANLS